VTASKSGESKFWASRKMFAIERHWENGWTLSRPWAIFYRKLLDLFRAGNDDLSYNQQCAVSLPTTLIKSLLQGSRNFVHPGDVGIER
jgi:hypothetical protein